MHIQNVQWAWRVTIWVLISIAVLLIVGYCVFELLPNRYVPTSGLSAEAEMKARNDVRTSALQMLGGTAIIVGAIFTGQTYLLNRQGQITDRFANAIEHLGSPEMDVRLGGIYALERIAWDSRRDHTIVMDILSTYVRERTRKVDDHSMFPSDLQAAITVIGRRRFIQDPETYRIDLSQADLRGANLAYAWLQRAHLSRASLQGAILAKANLTEAWLIEAHLESASLMEADLNGAKLGNAKLQRAALYGADLRNADLTGAQLGQAQFAQGHGLSHASTVNAISRTVGAVPTLFNKVLSSALLDGADIKDSTYTSATSWPDQYDPEAAGAHLSTNDH